MSNHLQESFRDIVGASSPVQKVIKLIRSTEIIFNDIGYFSSCLSGIYSWSS